VLLKIVYLLTCQVLALACLVFRGDLAKGDELLVPRRENAVLRRHARHLHDVQDADTMLGRLVAHHSCAAIEAQERGLADVLADEFEPAPDALARALTFCDMTTSPDGEHVSVDSRLTEINCRYGPGHRVSRSIHRATPMILRAADQVRMAARSDPPAEAAVAQDEAAQEGQGSTNDC
jgi:hypothetical protein